LLKPDDVSPVTKFGVYCFGNLNKKEIPNLDFDYKDILIPALYDYHSKSELFNPSVFFKEQFQVGNKKDYSGRSEEDAYFKQVFYKFIGDVAFAAIVETTEMLPFSVEIDTMGADQSLYRIEATKLDDKPSIFEEIEDSNKSKTGAGRIVLLSDACVEPSILEKCNYAICDTTDFRNIITHSIKNEEGEKTQNFYQIESKRSNDTAYKTKVKYNLMKRGSVLYADDVNKLLSDLTNSIFYKIGYNNYQIIN
jgi:CRISPR-associated protein Cmr3